MAGTLPVVPGNPDILNTVHVAELLAMSTQEVTRGTREGRPPGHRKGPWQFERDEVLEWLRAHPAVGDDLAR